MFKDSAPKAQDDGVARARRLRKQMSLPEALVWRELRNRPGGLKFRRQHPSGRYVLDFYCSDATLAIEIDGFAHETCDRSDRDRSRDDWLAAHGIATFRIRAQEVLADLPRAIDAITAAAVARLPLHHPAAPGGPPPRDKLGED